MRTIIKYAMTIEGKFVVNMPQGGVIEADGNNLWVLVENDQATPQAQTFQVFRVGDDIPNEQPMPAVYTLSFWHGCSLWHLFQLFEAGE